MRIVAIYEWWKMRAIEYTVNGRAVSSFNFSNIARTKQKKSLEKCTLVHSIRVFRSQISMWIKCTIKYGNIRRMARISKHLHSILNHNIQASDEWRQTLFLILFAQCLVEWCKWWTILSHVFTNSINMPSAISFGWIKFGCAMKLYHSFSHFTLNISF